MYHVINKSKFKVNTYMVYPEAGICVRIEDKLAMGFRARCILHAIFHLAIQEILNRNFCGRMFVQFVLHL